MEDQIKQIAQRLKGLREVLNLSPAEVASCCGLNVEEYLELETGSKDISGSYLQAISKRYGIALDVLMFGEEPRMQRYFITRKGTGISVERTKAYKYQSLAAGFRNRDMDPFIVTIEPKPASVPVYLNRHEGQEFILVIEGRLQLNIDGKEQILETGDSIYFDSSLSHGMLALGGKPVKFLSIIR